MRRGVVIALILLAAVTVGYVRPRVASAYHGVTVRSEVYPLPPPSALVAASLGHRSALADLIFAHVLVSNGIHAHENRRFEFAGAYLDAVNELDPKFRDPYRFADTLIVFGPDEAKLEHYLKAREIFERGLANRPYDTDLWLTAGQFFAYLARPHLPTKEMRDEWKAEGGKILARACELASQNASVPYHCITAARLLEQSGAREAAIQSLERLIAVNDDPAIEEMAMQYLAARLGERNKERQERRRSLFREALKADLPFVNKDMMLVLGPKTDTAACAGRNAGSELKCVTSWAAWAALADPAPED